MAAIPLTPWQSGLLGVLDSVESNYVNALQINVPGTFTSSSITPTPPNGYVLVTPIFPLTLYTLTINAPANYWQYILTITTSSGVFNFSIDTDCIQIWDSTFSANYTRNITLLNTLALGSESITPVPANGFQFNLISPLVYSLTINAIPNNPVTLYEFSFSLIGFIGIFRYYIVPGEVRLPDWADNDLNPYNTNVDVYFPIIADVGSGGNLIPNTPSSYSAIAVSNVSPPLAQTMTIDIAQTSGVVDYQLNVDNIATLTSDHIFYYIQALQCIAYGTSITLVNGEKKAIQDINRGDEVLGLNGNVHKVARVIVSNIDSESSLKLCVFPKDSVGNDEELIMTQDHPIYKDNNRYLAKSLGHTVVKTAKDVLQISPDGKYHLYDLQFETLGYYHASGIPVQSRSPKSKNTPLSKDLYFDQSLYSEDRYDDFEPGYEHPLIL